MFSDERQYLDLATNLVSGHGYTLFGQPTAYRPPAWPLLLAATFLAGVPTTALAVISGVALVGASAATRQIATHLAGPVAGWTAAFAMFAYPINAYTASTLYPQAFTTLMFLVSIALLLQGHELRTSSALLAGFCLSAMVLAAPTMAWTAVLVLAWAVWDQRRTPVKGLLVTTAAAAPIAAWTVRNAVEFHAFVPTSTATGVNLLLGNSPGATATSGVGADISAYTAGAQGLNEVDQDRYFTRQALNWVSSHPIDAAFLYVQKVGNYFAGYNTPQTTTAGGATASLVAWTSFIVAVTIAVARLTIVRRSPLKRPEVLLWTAMMSNALFMAVTFTRTRFRQPLDAVLIIEGAVFVALIISAVKSARTNKYVTSDAISSR
jgi:hypothetical protein